MRTLVIMAVTATAFTALASAEDKAADCPGFIVGGSEDVMAEGNPAAVVGTGVCVIAIEGSDNVQINGRGAVRVGDTVKCLNGKTGTVVGGATSVIINGKPLAGVGAQVIGCEE